jgi:trans-aconitate 2-methyltransferase
MTGCVSEFYDTYSKSQIKNRCASAALSPCCRKLKKAGLKKDSTVLEVGCGIGTLTGLLGSYKKMEKS